MIWKLFYLPQWGGGLSLIWLKRVCVVEQGVVFRVLSCKRGIKFHYMWSILNRVSFWFGSLLKEFEGLATIGILHLWYLFHDVGLKNCSVRYV